MLKFVLTMAFIDGTDIPSGLEEAWKAIFNFANSALQNIIQVAPRTVSRVKYSKIALRSLIVQWAPLYNSFDSARRASWDLYWGLLPFGSHSGANGWPGSGFSAFIYVNAPRFRYGAPLLYDPPVNLGPELLTNPNFITTLSPWEQDPFNYQAVLAYGSGLIAAEEEDQYFQTIWQFPAGLDAGTYYMAIVVAVPDGINFYSGSGIGFGEDSSPESLNDPLPFASNGFVSTLYEGYRTMGSDVSTRPFAINFTGDPGNGNIYVYSVSLKKVL